jgi:hypothetical protein
LRFIFSSLSAIIFRNAGSSGASFRCRGGDDKPLAKTILREVLLEPLEIGKGGWSLLLIRHCPS